MIRIDHHIGFNKGQFPFIDSFLFMTSTVVLILLGLSHFLLFHTAVELFGLIIIYCMLTIAVNTYQQSQNHFFMFLAIAYGFIGFPIVFHTLTYKGMDIFADITANTPTQLYMLMRYLMTFSLLLSFWFLKKALPIKKVVLGYGLTVGLLLLAIPLGVFPDCFIEGQGLTPFKIYSEYVNIVLLLAAISLLMKNKQHFHPKVYSYMAYSVFFTMASSLFFTFYISVFGISNILGHIAQLLSFYFIYKGIVETSLKNPFEFLYFELSKINDELHKKSQELKLKNEQLSDYNMEIMTQQEELSKAYERIYTDVENARKIHNRFLPDSFPEIEGLDFAYSYRPAKNIGGDFFNVQKVDNQLLIYLVDVSGHGLDGAILNIFIRENINSYLYNLKNTGEKITPSQVLTYLYASYNRESFPDEYYACTFVAVIDLKEQAITFSNAGLHISPYLINDGQLHRLEAKGLPIMGAIGGYSFPYDNHRLPLGENYTLLLTTDGLVEATSGNFTYGEERVAQLLFATDSLSAPEIVDSINHDFRSLVGNENYQDDITFLIVKNKSS